MGKEYLMIPGPTPIPEEVARAMSTEMFNHRGPRFKELIEQLTAELKKIFQTEGRLFILTASGTGGMEAAIVNLSTCTPYISAICASARPRNRLAGR